MRLIIRVILVLVAISGSAIPTASAAGLLISIDQLQQTAGSGSFQVILTNTEDPAGITYRVAGFTFELLSTHGSGLKFQGAEYPTSDLPGYLFEGTGQTVLDSAIPLSYDEFPTAHFSGADTEFVETSIPIGPGVSFSLGLITFETPSPVSLGSLQELIVRAGTVLSDENFEPIPYSLPNTSVPEPSSWVTLALGSIGVIGVASRHRT